MIGAVVRALADAGGFTSADSPTQALWSKASYLGTVIAPGTLLAFAVAQTDRQPIGRSELILLLIEPTVTLAPVWTDELHGPVRAQVTVTSAEPCFTVTREYGSRSWINVGYSWPLIAKSAYRLIVIALRMRHAHRRQGAVLLLRLRPPGRRLAAAGAPAHARLAAREPRLR